MNIPKRILMSGSLILLVGSCIGTGTCRPNVGLAITLLVIGLLHWGNNLRPYSAFGTGIAAVALIIGIGSLLTTWGMGLPFLKARPGLGPYLSILGSIIAIYGASRRVIVVSPFERFGEDQEYYATDDDVYYELAHRVEQNATVITH